MSTRAPPSRFPASARSCVLDDLVAVVGDHIWAAKSGLDALPITWDDGPNAQSQFERDLGQTCAPRAEKDGVVAKSVGDVDKGLDARATGSMPPMSCRSWRTPPWSR